MIAIRLLSAAGSLGRVLGGRPFQKSQIGTRMYHKPEGVECWQEWHVIDETPAGYKPIDAVMAAQADLVEIVHALR